MYHQSAPELHYPLFLPIIFDLYLLFAKCRIMATLIKNFLSLAAISPANQGPNRLSDVLKKLSILPARFQEVKRSCARAGALTALSRSKAWVPDLDLADVARGYPTMKEDGSPFD